MVRRHFPARVVVSLVLALGIVGGIVGTRLVVANDAGHVAARPPGSTSTTTTTTTTTTTLPPTTTTALPRYSQPPPATLPPVPASGLGPGSVGPVVAAYQQRLVDLKLDPGPVDGAFGSKMTYAVQAVQKLLGTPVTGRLSASEAGALATFQYPAPLAPDAEGDRTEIDVARQVLVLYHDYQVRLITTTSTGSGELYCYTSPRENPVERICEYARTPSGRYAYYFFYDGWHKGVLGELYNPFYFNHGIAVHGYQSVPPTPASHGCARIPMHIAEYFHTLVDKGDPVYVFGGQDPQIVSRTPLTGSGTTPTAPINPVPPPGEPAPAPDPAAIAPDPAATAPSIPAFDFS